MKNNNKILKYDKKNIYQIVARISNEMTGSVNIQHSTFMLSLL